MLLPELHNSSIVAIYSIEAILRIQLLTFRKILNLPEVSIVQHGCTLPKWESVIRGINQWDM